MALVGPEEPHRKLIGSRAVLTSASPRRNLDSRFSASSAGRAANQGYDAGCRWEEIRFDVTSSPSYAFQRQTAGVYHSAPFSEATAAAKRRGASSGPMLPLDLPRLSMDAGARSADVTRGLDPSSADNTASITTSDDDYRDGGDGAGAGGSETSAISDRERLFLQQLRRSSIATRERILSNVADVWISHQESESWLGQLEKLAAAQQSGKHVHVTTRYGEQQHATRRTAAGSFRNASQSMAERQQQLEGDPPQLAEIQAAHLPRGVRKLKRNGESAKSAQFEYSPQQPLSPPTGEQKVGAHAQLFERTSTAPSGTTSTTVITSSNNSVGSGSGSGSGGSGGRATVVSGALSRKSWLFGFTSRSTQERSTSRLGASPHGGS